MNKIKLVLSDRFAAEIVFCRYNQFLENTLLEVSNGQ